MKQLLLALAVLTSFHAAHQARDGGPPPSVSQETKGICSPIVPDNKGTLNITCSGFSEKETKIIIEFLRQLSNNQSKDQSVLLAKVNELLDVAHGLERQVSPRVIPGETLIAMHRNFSWGACLPIHALIVASHGDEEAAHLGNQLGNVLNTEGMDASFTYGDLPSRTDEADIVAISADRDNTLCALDGLTMFIQRMFSIKFEEKQIADTASGKSPAEPKRPPTADVLIYVYPKRATR